MGKYYSNILTFSGMFSTNLLFILWHFLACQSMQSGFPVERADYNTKQLGSAGQILLQVKCTDAVIKLNNGSPRQVLLRVFNNGTVRHVCSFYVYIGQKVLFLLLADAFVLICTDNMDVALTYRCHIHL